LQKIGNGIGRFIDKADTKFNYTCARIYVKVDLEVGLPEAVKLSIGSWFYYQKIDYEHLPFKCKNCREHGHFQRNCPKAQTPHKEDSEGWKKVKRNKAAQKPREKCPEEETGQPSSSTPIPQAPPPPPSTESIPTPTSQTLPPKDSSTPAMETLPLEDPPKSDEEHISIGFETGADLEEGATETNSSVRTPEKAPRGRKSKRKKREEKSYRDVAVGTQKIIPDMMMTRSTKKAGKAPNGASTPPSPKFLMHYVSWNCRGLGNKPKEEAIKDLVRMSNPEVLLIQETKMEESETLQASKNF
jgi:hypothetical protein